MAHLQPTRVMTFGGLNGPFALPRLPQYRFPRLQAMQANQRVRLQKRYDPARDPMGTVRLAGGVSAVAPMLRTNFIQQPYVRPLRPQNVLKHAFTSGIGRIGRTLAGLGQAADEILDPWAMDSINASEIPAVTGPLQPSVTGPGDIPALSHEGNPDTMTQVQGQLDQAYAEDYIQLPGGAAVRRSHFGLGLSLSVISGAVSAYHGYRRDRGSWGSAFGWGMLGMMFPIITPAVAFFMKPGFAKAAHH